MQQSNTYEASVSSNIAFLKYWGKLDSKLQWPANDSLSMTLDSLKSVTQAKIINDRDHHVVLEDRTIGRDHSQGKKIFDHLDYLASRFSKSEKLSIQSKNSFPTGCGIASSASGLGALTLASLAAWFSIESIEELSSIPLTQHELALLARQGSGSAGRSLFGGFVRWSKGDSPEDQTIHQCYGQKHWPLRDTVVLFSSAEKSVGSTAAHKAAWSSPLFAPRLANLENRLGKMLEAIEHKNMRQLGPLIEDETLEMHAVIMSASPAVFYFGKDTGEFLAWLRRERDKLDLPVYFTLDAGPNVHLIYEDEHHDGVMDLLAQGEHKFELLCDRIGAGPQLKVWRDSSEQK